MGSEDRVFLHLKGVFEGEDVALMLSIKLIGVSGVRRGGLGYVRLHPCLFFVRIEINSLRCRPVML